jgi:tetratricopeptide (TPR) repeat protein
MSDALEELRARLLRYPADRHPTEHATGQLHLGAHLLQAGDPEAAAVALRTAVATYAPAMLVERATAANLLGAALRDARRHTAAEEAFVAAAAGFAEAQRPVEEAAALHNLGLIQRDRGDMGAAGERFAASLRAFEDAEAWSQAAAAARELAACLLETGRAAAAVDAATTAVAHADRGGDAAGLAAAENVAGLAHLARDRPEVAAAAFARSAAASPRHVRPEAYAMARANGALACEQAGDPPLARVLARQALGAPVVPPAVGRLARSVLDQLGDGDGDLHDVLARDPQAWTGVLRDELSWWADAKTPLRRSQVGAFLAGLPAAPAAEDLTAAWVGVLLELPPGHMERLVRDAMHALAAWSPADRDRVRGLLNRALPRYPLPQWQRLSAVLNSAAGEAFGDHGWP